MFLSDVGGVLYAWELGDQLWYQQYRPLPSHLYFNLLKHSSVDQF